MPRCELLQLVIRESCFSSGLFSVNLVFGVFLGRFPQVTRVTFGETFVSSVDRVLPQFLPALIIVKLQLWKELVI